MQHRAGMIRSKRRGKPFVVQGTVVVDHTPVIAESRHNHPGQPENPAMQRLPARRLKHWQSRPNYPNVSRRFITHGVNVIYSEQSRTRTRV